MAPASRCAWPAASARWASPPTPSAWRASSTGKPLELTQVTIERQCENEFIKDLAEPAADVDAIVSFGCGVGVQAIAERFPDKPVYAGLNTQFLGILEEQAVWTEKCLGCGDCMLAQFGGICPVTRCAKRLLNGPCGGSTETHCEVDPDRPCAWQLIYTRLKSIDQLDRLDESFRPRIGARPGTAARARWCAKSTGWGSSSHLLGRCRFSAECAGSPGLRRGLKRFSPRPLRSLQQRQGCDPCPNPAASRSPGVPRRGRGQVRSDSRGHPPILRISGLLSVIASFPCCL